MPKATPDPRTVAPGKGLRETKPIPRVIQLKAGSNFAIAESGCWESQWSKQGKGYAVISQKVAGKVSVYLAHRAAWTLYNGGIPQGMVVDHMCFNRACVRPDHLRLLTLRENTRNKLGVHVPAGQCKNGHPDSDLKLVKSGRGKMQNVCTSCLRERNARTAERLRLAKQASHNVGTPTLDGVGTPE